DTADLFFNLLGLRPRLRTTHGATAAPDQRHNVTGARSARHGFAPDISTSAFVFVFAEPERRAARIATTTSCTACEPRPFSMISILASLAAAFVKTFALIYGRLPWLRPSSLRPILRLSSASWRAPPHRLSRVARAQRSALPDS